MRTPLNSIIASAAPAALAAQAPAPLQIDIPPIEGARPPVEIFDPWPWIALAGIWAIALAALAAWLFFQRKGKEKAQVTVAIDPYQKALSALADARSLLQPGKAEEYVVRVSEALRRYLEEALRVPALEQTTEEFLAHAAERPLLKGEPAEQLDRFLSQCDEVKFARAQLEQPAMESLQQIAEGVVRQTHERALSAARALEQARKEGANP